MSSYQFWENDDHSTLVVGFTTSGVKSKDIEQELTSSSQLGEFKIAYLNQRHSATINFISQPGVYEGDGLLTLTEGLLLIVRTADCLPLLLWDKKSRLIGAIHLGWRPARAGIIDNLKKKIFDIYEKMYQEGEVRREKYPIDSLKVLVGVGLRRCCFEVGKEFLEYGIFTNFLEQRKSNWYLDLVSFAKEKLNKGGISCREFIDIGRCSFCDGDRFPSFRRDKTEQRILSFIGWKQ